MNPVINPAEIQEAVKAGPDTSGEVVDEEWEEILRLARAGHCLILDLFREDEDDQATQ